MGWPVTRPIKYQGEIKSISDWARHFDMPVARLWQRMQRGAAFEEAIKPGRKPSGHRSALKTIDGETKHIREWCQEYNTDYEMVRHRLSRKWDLKRALTEPNKHPKKS